MEDSPDFLAITGILVNSKAKFGDLSKLTYRYSGSQEIISYILGALRAHLKNKNYVEEDLPKSEFTVYFEELVLFLMVNCEFSQSFTVEEYAHLRYNIPKISKYVLSKIVVDMKLVKYFSRTVEKLPLLYSCELFEEFLPCLDKLNLKLLLQDTYVLLHTIAVIIVKNQDRKHCDELDKIMEIVPEFFLKLYTLSSEHLRKLKKATFYKQVGYLLGNLFSLLLYCNENNLKDGYFVDKLIETSTNIVHSVSLDMFIQWAEIDLESGKTLQNEVGEQAYTIINKYEHSKMAAELVQSLKHFASKPKEFKELIQSADTEKMVLMINRADENQKKWFQALVFTNFFSNKRAVECISNWSHLCDADDVSRVLDLSAEANQRDIYQLALKCCSNLCIEELVIVVIRHFHHNGFVVMDSEVQLQIVPMFNLLKNSESVDKKFTFELLLIILQNPEACIYLVFKESLSSSFYVSVLKEFLSMLKDVLKVRNLGPNSISKIIEASPIREETKNKFRDLLEIVLDIGLLTNETLICKIINPALTDLLKKNDIEHVKYILESLNSLDMSVPLKESTDHFIENLFKILSMRTQFINHRSLEQVVVREVVNIINNKVQKNGETQLHALDINSGDDNFISYYKKLISTTDKKLSLLHHLCHDFNIENSTKTVCSLMKILPLCVTEEWISIYLEMIQGSCCKDVMGVTTDMMMLLCQFTQKQEHSDNYFVLQDALKYCVNQLGIVIQNTMLRSNSDLEDEVHVTEGLINMLCYLPSTIKDTEGFNIVTMMTERSLKNLGRNQAFVAKICRIKNTKLCQVIAQKILS